MEELEKIVKQTQGEIIKIKNRVKANDERGRNLEKAIEAQGQDLQDTG